MLSPLVFEFPDAEGAYEGTLTRCSHQKPGVYEERARWECFRVREDSRWGSSTFETFMVLATALCQRLRPEKRANRCWWSSSISWRWNADLSWLIDSTTVEWLREEVSVEWAIDTFPRFSLKVWRLPPYRVSEALARRAHQHFLAGRFALFYRDFVGAHYFDRGNAGAATVLVNAFQSRVVRAIDRLDLVAMCGTTKDFLNAWYNSSTPYVVDPVGILDDRSHLSSLDACENG